MTFLVPSEGDKFAKKRVAGAGQSAPASTLPSDHIFQPTGLLAYKHRSNKLHSDSVTMFAHHVGMGCQPPQSFEPRIPQHGVIDRLPWHLT